MIPRADLLRACLLGAALALPLAAGAQVDTVSVVPGERYRAGPLRRALLGSSYRDLWTAPVRVPVLDLGAFAGGLEPTGEGGGNQTLSLRLRGADGREYAFRSVDKHPGRRSGTAGPVAAVVQDQVSAQVPAGPLAAARLAAALGLLHVRPHLFVMPDDARLGPYRARFAGMLGQLEERPRAGFAGAADTEDTDDFLERIEDSPAERVAAREYLASRLLDLVLGDWDRHAGQYRWARFDSAGATLWRPIALDRDYVFVDYDGLLPDLARPHLVKLVRHGERIGHLEGLMEQAAPLDRRLLAGLERPAWDSVTAFVRTRLTDRAIDEALAALPPEHRALRGEALAARLRARRDDLPRAADRFYRALAREAEAQGTDRDEVAEVAHTPAGVEVRIALPGAEPHFHRRYLAGETREVRVLLRGGDDRAAVTGAGPVLVRVVGGGGDDALGDRGTGRTAFYDDRGENRFARGPRTVVDTRPWEAPEPRSGASPPRDWGTRWTPLALGVETRPHAGLVLTAGPRRVRHGFRRHPAAEESHARLLWSPTAGRVGAEARHLRRWTGSDGYGWLFGRASGIEATAFGGFGNRAPDERRVHRERQYLAEAGVSAPAGAGLTLTGALLARHTVPEAEAPVRGLEGAWWAAGARGGARIERLRGEGVPRAGWALEGSGSVHPLSTAGEGGVFGTARGEATAHLPLGAPVLALRAGSEAAWGAFPVQHAAFLGGSRTLRGHRHHRLAGDRSAYGSAELRLPLGGAAGVFLMGDAGRVWHQGRSPGGWHTAAGGGAWVGIMGRVVIATLAVGESPVLYLGLGPPVR